MDKLLHFAISFVLTTCLNTVMPPKQANRVAFSIGMGKEVWDYHNPPHSAEWGDLAADLVGIIAADKALEVIRCQTATAPTVGQQ